MASKKISCAFTEIADSMRKLDDIDHMIAADKDEMV